MASPSPAFTAQSVSKNPLGYQIVVRLADGRNTTTVHRNLAQVARLRDALADSPDAGVVPKVDRDEFMVQYFVSWLGTNPEVASNPAVRQFLELPPSVPPASAGAAAAASSKSSSAQVRRSVSSSSSSSWPRIVFLWAALTVAIISSSQGPSSPAHKPSARTGVRLDDASHATLKNATTASVSASLSAVPAFTTTSSAIEALPKAKSPAIQSMHNQLGAIITYVWSNASLVRPERIAGNNNASNNEEEEEEEELGEAGEPVLVENADLGNRISLDALSRVEMYSSLSGFAYAAEANQQPQQPQQPVDEKVSASAAVLHQSESASKGYNSPLMGLSGVFFFLFVVALAFEYQYDAARKLEDTAFSRARDWYRARSDNLPEDVKSRADALINRVVVGPSPSRRLVSVSEAAFEQWIALDAWTPSRARLAFVALMDGLRDQEQQLSTSKSEATVASVLAAAVKTSNSSVVLNNNHTNADESFDSTDVSDEVAPSPKTSSTVASPANNASKKLEGPATPILPASAVFSASASTKERAAPVEKQDGWSVEAMVAATAVTVVGAAVVRRFMASG